MYESNECPDRTLWMHGCCKASSGPFLLANVFARILLFLCDCFVFYFFCSDCLCVVICIGVLVACFYCCCFVVVVLVLVL